MSDRGYARPELLAEPDWVRDHREDHQVRIIDCRGEQDYRAGHIPGAVWLGAHNWLKGPDKVHVMSAEDFGALMGSRGVGNDALVIAYSASNSLPATRVWWVLNHYGHVGAKVLNGGWERWVAEGRPQSTDEPSIEPRTFAARQDDRVVCRLDDLRARRDSFQIIDARADDEWTGAGNPHKNQRVGHIPGAIHLEWVRLVDPDHHTFKPADQLRAELDAAGVRPDRETVTHCQAAIRAAHVAFVLSLMGYDRVRVYDGSMAEWANRQDTPLVTERT